MRIGYACIPLGIDARTTRRCLLKNCSEEKLRELIEFNLRDLMKILDYNMNNHIYLFRISSDIIPFASHPEVNFKWWEFFRSELEEIGRYVTKNGIRVSMHPGQYTVLNSPREEVVSNAVNDLIYHARFLASLGLDWSHKIVLHIGGKYGNKKEAEKRFCQNFSLLPEEVKRRLVIENDEKTFNIADVMRIHEVTGLPVVFDVFHHTVNPSRGKLDEIIRQVGNTWKEKDGNFKIHYSHQAAGKAPGAHSNFIYCEKFLPFLEIIKGYDPDIMFEVKDKDLSAIKIISLLRGKSQDFEILWSKYKYLVMERCPHSYKSMKEVIKKRDFIEGYILLDTAISKKYNPHYFRNASQHVWGYFKSKATEKEKEKFFYLLESLDEDPKTAHRVKKYLYKLAKKYREAYLLNSYYFVSVY